MLVVRGYSGLFAGAASGAIAGYTVSWIPTIHATVYCSAFGAIFGIASTYWTARIQLKSPLPNTVWSWVGVVFTLLLSIGFASNSFTIWEDEILLFFLTTIGVLFLCSSLRQSGVNRTLGVYHSASFVLLGRLASFSRLCREEQMPYCVSTYYSSANSSTSASWQLSIPYILAFLLPGIVASYYEGTRSYHGMATLWIGFAFRLGLLLTALFWTLDAADDGNWLPQIPSAYLKTTKVILAQIVLGTAFAAGYSTYTWCAPLLQIQSRPSRAQDARKIWDKGDLVLSRDGASALTVQGYSNLHGSRYALLLTVWTLGITVLQKPMGQAAMGILLWQIFCLLEIVAVNGLADKVVVGPTVLALLGGYHFFKTGHQATLSSIQWESAFVPLKGVRYPWSPLLVVLNTFGPQILCAVAVPATVLWKQPARKKGLLGAVAGAVATHLLVLATVGVATTVWAGWLRRHLMLYRIFSPRWMVASGVLLVVDLVAVLVGIGGTKWSFGSVAEVFGWA